LAAFSTLDIVAADVTGFGSRTIYGPGPHTPLHASRLERMLDRCAQQRRGGDRVQQTLLRFPQGREVGDATHVDGSTQLRRVRQNRDDPTIVCLVKRLEYQARIQLRLRELLGAVAVRIADGDESPLLGVYDITPV